MRGVHPMERENADLKAENAELRGAIKIALVAIQTGVETVAVAALSQALTLREEVGR
jgi:alanine racemase